MLVRGTVRFPALSAIAGADQMPGGL